MAKTNLVIVESPSKASTIKGYLGSNYKVIASKGHVRDLPKSTLGVDIDDNFAVKYINIRGKGDLIKEIKKEAGCVRVYFPKEGDTLWEIAKMYHTTVAALKENNDEDAKTLII